MYVIYHYIFVCVLLASLNILLANIGHRSKANWYLKNEARIAYSLSGVLCVYTRSLALTNDTIFSILCSHGLPIFRFLLFCVFALNPQGIG